MVTSQVLHFPSIIIVSITQALCISALLPIIHRTHFASTAIFLSIYRYSVCDKDSHEDEMIMIDML
jgi:hypothetical protein